MRIVTLTTDFGTSDSYVAQMKGLLLSLAPDLSLVDLTHEIPPCDIRNAARILAEAAPMFPAGTIHLAVVDPGVGGNRKRVIIRGKVKAEFEANPKEAWFVGPDNGIFSLALPRENQMEVWQIENLQKLPRFTSGQTFDGRNIFAPVAARLAMGEHPSAFGPALQGEASRLVGVELFTQPNRVDGLLRGQIVSFDHFGNAATNIARSLLGSGKVLINLPKNNITLELRHSFELFSTGEAGCIINSQGFLEVVVNRGNARRQLSLEVGDAAQVSTG